MFSRLVPDPGQANPLARRLSRLREAGASLVDLTGSNPTRAGLPGPAPEALARLADPSVGDYEPDPRGDLAAREAVAGYYADLGAPVDPGRIFLTASTSEAYTHLFRLFGEPGDRFLAPAPSYPLFEPLARLSSVELVHYPLRYDGRWWLDRDDFDRALAAPRVRGLLLVQPNNPTGSTLDRSEREFVIGRAARAGIPVIADEVFLDFPAAEALPTLAGGTEVLAIVLSGLSKVCGTPQLKLGWMALSGPERLVGEAQARLDWICDALLSVGAPVQRALPGLLAGRRAFLAAANARLLENERVIDAGIAGTPITRRNRQGGWSALLQLPRTRTDLEWCLELLERRVIAHPGHFYDCEEESLLALSLLVPPADMAAGIGTLVRLVGADGAGDR